MSAENVINEIRDSLNGRPGQAMVFGVCVNLANRLGTEPWTARLAALVLALLWTLPTLAAYVIAGLLLPQTEARTRRFFCGLAIIARETLDKLAAGLRDLFRGHHHRSTGY